MQMVISRLPPATGTATATHLSQMQGYISHQHRRRRWMPRVRRVTPKQPTLNTPNMAVSASKHVEKHANMKADWGDKLAQNP